MEMLDLNTVWSATLTLLVSVMAYIVNEKFRELARVTILLNKTREEVARDNVTQAEVDRITNHIDQRFNKLEAKIDQLIQAGR
jgi:biopolymer transport protein ExbB/TolQ